MSQSSCSNNCPCAVWFKLREGEEVDDEEKCRCEENRLACANVNYPPLDWTDDIEGDNE